MQVQVLKADQDIVRIGDRPSQCCLLMEGYTCVYKLTSEGKRQIMAFHVPGDIPDLQSLHLKVMDNSLATMCSCTVGFIQHEDLRRVCERYPRITAAFGARRWWTPRSSGSGCSISGGAKPTPGWRTFSASSR